MTEPTYSPLTAKEQNWIVKQLEGAGLFVEAMSPADAGKPITLAALDRAFAAWIPQAGEDLEQINAAINVVGIQFGQFLVDQLGFEWTIATDSHGTDLAVRTLPGRGDVLVYPANFVAKRWERRESNSLAASFKRIRGDVAAIATTRGSEEKRPWWRFWK